MGPLPQACPRDLASLPRAHITWSGCAVYSPLCRQRRISRRKHQPLFQGLLNPCWLLNAFLLVVMMDVEGPGHGSPSTEACVSVLTRQVLSPALEMMGLGNGRRSMKSPPLVLAALVACIIVLGFNYWIASSRSVDLQVFSWSCLCGGHRVFRAAGCWILRSSRFVGP